MTNEEAAGRIADFMANAESSIHDMRDDARDLTAAFEQLATMEGVSTLKTLKHATRVDAILTTALADLYAAHSEMTTDAIEAGVEAILPQPRGGTR